MAGSRGPSGQRDDIPFEDDDRAAEATPEEPDADEPTPDADQVEGDPGADDEALVAAAKTAGPRPVKRNLTVAPVRKAAPTRKREEAATTVTRRTTPVEFVKQSIGELKKVVWPTSTILRQYFIVVLIFVLFIMFFVAGLDALFGWLLLLFLS